MPEATNTAGQTQAPAAPAATTTAPTTVDGAVTLELSHTFADFTDTERTVTCHFRRPSRHQISRAQSGMRKDALQAMGTLCLDCVVPEEREHLKIVLAEYPGLAGSFGNEILARVGFGELGK